MCHTKREKRWALRDREWNLHCMLNHMIYIDVGIWGSVIVPTVYCALSQERERVRERERDCSECIEYQKINTAQNSTMLYNWVAGDNLERKKLAPSPPPAHTDSRCGCKCWCVCVKNVFLYFVYGPGWNLTTTHSKQTDRRTDSSSWWT